MTLFQFAAVLIALPLSAQQYVDTAANQTSRRANDPAAVELFRDRGLGLFIHWRVDGALGGVISHSLVGTPDYVDRFFHILPGTFNPERYQPEKKLTAADRLFWAWLSELWSDWRAALVIVKPETLIAWHRKSFRLFWTWKVRSGIRADPP